MSSKTPKVFTAKHNGKSFAVLVGQNDQLLASGFSSRDAEPVGEHVARHASNATIVEQDHPLIQEMARMCDGESSSEEVNLDLERVTSFQKQVYKVLQKIPKGRVTTYGMISKAIDSGPRAVGTAVASNPWPLFVPCHRVVPVSMTIGNYSMNGKPDMEGSDVKRELLENEGVKFIGDRVDGSCLWKPRA
jgi:methylated-DNA-[protein]-cysteine S-methyltransferase